MINRKYESINLLELYFNGKEKEWNNWLAKCVNLNDWPALEKMYYSIQCGMTDLANDKLNTAKMVQTFQRMQKSIENTMKIIWRKKHPSPCYNPLYKNYTMDQLVEKRKFDNEFEKYLKRIRF